MQKNKWTKNYITKALTIGDLVVFCLLRANFLKQVRPIINYKSPFNLYLQLNNTTRVLFLKAEFLSFLFFISNNNLS